MKKIFTLLLLFLISFPFVETGKAEAATVYWPVPQSQRVTQEYKAGVHLGIDIGGSTPGVAGNNIVAMHNGVVSRAGWSDSYGHVVYINHEGSNKVLDSNIQSRYAHLRDWPLVRVGSSISGRTLIGYMGNTGQSQGVHLHFETRVCNGACATDNSSSRGPGRKTRKIYAKQIST